MTNFKLSLSFVTPDGPFIEHESKHTSYEDAIEEADEVAFGTVGYPIENWNSNPLDFGEGNKLFVYYPNEEDKSSRYRLAITREGV